MTREYPENYRMRVDPTGQIECADKFQEKNIYALLMYAIAKPLVFFVSPGLFRFLGKEFSFLRRNISLGISSPTADEKNI